MLVRTTRIIVLLSISFFVFFQGTARAQNNNSADASLTVAQSFGLCAKTWSKVEADSALVTSLDMLPESAKDLYKTLTPADRVEFNKESHGVTRAGIFTIDNKKALIAGEVMGHNVFECLKERADQDWMDQKITDDQYVRKEAVYDILAGLTPAQRATLVHLLEVDSSVLTISAKSVAQAR